MDSTSHAFKDNARAALASQTLQKAMKHVKTGFIDKRAKARAKLPEFDALRDAARDIKDHTLANLDFYLRSEEHTSELQSLMRNSYAVFCLKKQKQAHHTSTNN